MMKVIMVLMCMIADNYDLSMIVYTTVGGFTTITISVFIVCALISHRYRYV